MGRTAGRTVEQKLLNKAVDNVVTSQSHLDGSGFAPWDKRPNESAADFMWFTRYRNLGPLRTLRLTRGVSKTDANRRPRGITVAEQHDWAARAAAWDAHCDRIRRIGLLEAQKNVAASHQEAGSYLREHCMKLIKKTLGSADLGEKLPFKDLIRLFEVAIKLEQVTLGMPTDNNQVHILKEGETPSDVYFAALPEERLLAMTRQALDVIEGTRPATGDTVEPTSPAETDASRDRDAGSPRPPA